MQITIGDVVTAVLKRPLVSGSAPNAMAQLRVSLFVGEPESVGAREVAFLNVERSDRHWLTVGSEDDAVSFIRNRDWFEFPEGTEAPTHWAIGPAEGMVYFYGRISRWESEQRRLAPGSIRVAVS